MKKLVKAVFSPAKLIIGLALVLAIGMTAGKVGVFPKAHAAADVLPCDSINQQNCVPASEQPTCNSDTLSNSECCLLDKEIVNIPAGYHKDTDTNICMQDPPAQVLSDSTAATVPSTPQVLASTTFAGK